jgi:FdhD protein
VATGTAQRRLADGRLDRLVEEEPLLLVVDGQPLLTMRTPGRDEDLAVGFLLGEGVVRRADEVGEMTAHAAREDRPAELQIRLRSGPSPLAKARLTRTHEIRSSCGICGSADLQAALDGALPLLPGVPRLPRRSVAELLAALRARQPLFDATGGSHGALVADAHGRLLGHGEDVGRHNALDKAIGMAARSGADLGTAIAVLSGRAGFDLVVKCLRARVPVIVSVSAPSAAAFDLCNAAGATLLGFARGDSFVTYCGAERLTE